MKNAIILLTLLVFPFVLSAQSVEFVFNFTKHDRANDIVKLNYDEGYMLLGLTRNDDSVSTLFIRFDDYGDTLWTKQMPSIGMGDITDVDSSYYYLCGAKNNYASIEKLDKNLNLIWQKTYPDIHNSPLYSWTYFKSLKNASGHKLLIDGETDYYNNPPHTFACLMDTAGNLVWKKYSFDDLEGLQQLSNNNFFFTWDEFNFYWGLPYNFHAIVDTAGNTLDVTRFGDSLDYLSPMAVYKDTAYVSFVNIQSHVLKIIKIAAITGDTIWSKVYFRGSDFNELNIASACYTSENQILFACYGYKDDLSSYDSQYSTFIFTINSSGDSISILYINKFDDVGPIKIISYNNSFCFIGNIYYGNDSSDIYFLKAPLDTLFVGSSPQVAVKTDRLNLSPNPVADRVTVSLSANSKEPTQIKVFRINGTAVYNKTVPPGMGRLEINVSSWPKGLYIFTLYEEGTVVQAEKVMVTR